MENELSATKLKFEYLNKQLNEILKTESEVNKFQKLIVLTLQLEEQLKQYTYTHQKQKQKIMNLRQVKYKKKNIKNNMNQNIMNLKNSKKIMNKKFKRKISINKLLRIQINNSCINKHQFYNFKLIQKSRECQYLRNNINLKNQKINIKQRNHGQLIKKKYLQYHKKYQMKKLTKIIFQQHMMK